MLNVNQVEDLVVKAKSDDNAAILQLVDHFKPFIERCVGQAYINTFEKIDFMQIGYVALINSLTKYKLGSKSFCGYAYRAIKNSINYTIRGNIKHTKISINKTITEDKNIELIDTIEDVLNIDDSLLKKERVTEVRKLLKILDESEMELVIFIYYSNFTLKEYSRKKGISYQTAIRKRNGILDKLRIEAEKLR